jgi:hypothetical protein
MRLNNCAKSTNIVATSQAIHIAYLLSLIQLNTLKLYSNDLLALRLLNIYLEINKVNALLVNRYQMINERP